MSTHVLSEPATGRFPTALKYRCTSGEKAPESVQDGLGRCSPCLESHGCDNGRFWLTVAYSRIEAEGHPNCQNTPTSIGRFCCCFCGEVWRGAAPSNGKRTKFASSLREERSLYGRSFGRFPRCLSVSLSFLVSEKYQRSGKLKETKWLRDFRSQSITAWSQSITLFSSQVPENLGAPSVAKYHSWTAQTHRVIHNRTETLTS